MTAHEKETLIQFILGVYPMSRRQTEEIAEHFKEKEFAKNDIVLKEGRICQEYYFLEEGFMRAYTHDLEGNDVTTAFYSPRNIVCELLSFFKRVPTRENIQALTDCKVWYLDFNELQLVFHTLIEFREFGRLVLVQFYGQLKQRMLSSLHETAEERYANLLRSNPDIFQNASLKHIASYLGITDTSLSRIRKEFSKKM